MTKIEFIFLFMNLQPERMSAKLETQWQAFDSKCGNTVLNVNLGKGVASKVVVNNDNLYIGIAGEADKNISGFTSKDNLITGKSKAKGGGGAITVEGWKEN